MAMLNNQMVYHLEYVSHDARPILAASWYENPSLDHRQPSLNHILAPKKYPNDLDKL